MVLSSHAIARGIADRIIDPSLKEELRSLVRIVIATEDGIQTTPEFESRYQGYSRGDKFAMYCNELERKSSSAYAKTIFVQRQSRKNIRNR